MNSIPLLAAGAASLFVAAAFAQPPGQPYGRGTPNEVYQQRPPYNPDYDYNYGQDYGRGRGGRIEAVYAVEARANDVRIRVSSNGCTRREDFRINRTGGRSGVEITFQRVRPDNCRAFAAGGVWLSFNYRDLGVQRGGEFTLGNPLTPWIGPGQ